MAIIETRKKSDDALSTKMIGAQLAQNLKGGEVVFFEGELGAGKTTFIQGLLAQLSYQGVVISPTFVLQQIYEVEPKILHMDLYRLEKGIELRELGLADFLDYTMLIEWGSNFAAFLPPPDLIIEITYLSATKRQLLFNCQHDKNYLLRGIDDDTRN